MRLIRNLLLPALFTACPAAASVTLHAAAAEIQTISPAAGRSGDTVTIIGQGFGAFNVRITVGGVPADVVSANGNKVTFRVPAGVRPGTADVVATNPGGRSGTIDFTVIDGILLPGAAASLMKDATFDLHPDVGLSADQIVNGVAMTELEVFFSPDATVVQVNDALRLVNGGIVGMAKGLTAVTIAVPRAASVDALEAMAGTLNRLPGVQQAIAAHLATPAIVFTQTPPGEPGFSQSMAFMHHLVPSRFPAAWNALPRGFLDGGLCPVTPVPVLVADLFSSRATGATELLPPSFRGPANPASGFPAERLAHGYLVSNVLAAVANETFVGANPFGSLGCMDLRLIQQAGWIPNMATDFIASNLPSTGKAVVNYSMGFSSECAADPCVPSHDRLTGAHERAWDAKYWKERTRSRWRDFLMVVAAGNERDAESAIIYPGMSDARYVSEMAIAQLPDPRFTFAASPDLWNPDPAFVPFGFDSLALDASDSQVLADALERAGLAGPDAVADNVIVVGSATRQTASSLLTQHVTGNQLGESVFSNAHVDVLAVGEEIFDDPALNGTSFSAPIVSGLASYLWMISPDLRDEPVSMTKQAIVANARNHVLDAYATVLSLDEAIAPALGRMPVRETLLDIDRDGQFTDADIAIFMSVLFQHAPDGTIIGPAPDTIKDFSRADLNGDGFTTAGARRERFDLDREHSTRFGATHYTTVTQRINGEDISFNEGELTDLEILCYYSYSPLFQGVEATRDALLEGRCGVSVTPRSATLTSGQQQRFTARMPSNSPVNWSTTAPDGGVDAAGVFTAGSTPGTYKVRATDANDPSVFGEATVTIDASSGTFRADQEITVRLGAEDPVTFQSLLSEPTRLSADNSFFSSSAPLPLDLDRSGTYQNSSGSATFALKAHANFPQAGPLLVPSIGTHSANVSCTSNGDISGPRTGSNAFGSLNVPALAADGRTPADITMSLGGQITRGPGAGGLDGTASFTASVRVDWTSAGVRQQSFMIRAADYASNPGGEVSTSIDRVLQVQAPGFVAINWTIDAGCEARGLTQDGAREVDAAGGSLVLTYSLRR